MVPKWNNQKKDKDWFLPVLIFFTKIYHYFQNYLCSILNISNLFLIMQFAQKIHKKFGTDFSRNYGFF